MRLRWKKELRETGLRAVVAGSLRGSKLHDGATEYATVYPLGESGMRPLKGWYWVCTASAVGEWRNTSNDPAPDEATAKAQAMAFVKSALAKKKAAA